MTKKQMVNLLHDWYFTPAKCWQFWLMQSGWPGGLILGAIVVTAVIMWRFW